MFVGHEFLAFAIAGWGASRLGADSRTALRLGMVAGLAALLPDLDVLYAAAIYAVAVASGTPLGWEAFWGVANGVHRVVTHPLPVGIAAATVFGLGSAIGTRWPTSQRPHRNLATAALYGLATVLYAPLLVRSFWTTAGVPEAVVASAFLAVVGIVGVIVSRRLRLPTSAMTAAAGVGFLTHPFGDVFLATPPPLLSPFGPPVLTERVSLAADPTLELFGVLFVELAVVWLGVLVALQLGISQRSASPAGVSRIGVFDRLRESVDRRAGIGVAYAVTVPILPRPTIVDAHLLGFTIVPLAVIVGLWVAARQRTGLTQWVSSGRTRHSVGAATFFGVSTGLATLTLAAIGYVTTYVLANAELLPSALG